MAGCSTDPLPVERDRCGECDDDLNDDHSSSASSAARGAPHRAPSVASGASYVERGDADGDIYTIFTILCTERDIGTKEHGGAARSLSDLVLTLRNGGIVSKRGQMKLSCVSASLLRRRVRMVDAIAAHVNTKQNEQTQASQARLAQLREDLANFEQTALLVFIAIAAVDLAARAGIAFDAGAARADLEAARQRCIWTDLCRVAPKRRAILNDDGEELELNELNRVLTEELIQRPYYDSSAGAATDGGWGDALHAQSSSPGATASAALRLCGSMLASMRASEFKALRELEGVFARGLADQMALQLLKNDGGDFSSLSAHAVVSLSDEERRSRLQSIVTAAESESGQATIRDVLLSFVAPKRVVGQRRTLALDRETSDLLTRNYPWLAACAHAAAMEGAEYIWSKSGSELKRSVVLLTGIALLTTPSNVDDVLRKATAGGGRIQLPFWATKPPAPDVARLALVASTQSWVVYTLSAKGKPTTCFSGTGLQGLETAALVLHNTL
jgi:hypothetical protein